MKKNIDDNYQNSQNVGFFQFPCFFPMVLLGHYIYAGAQPEIFQGKGGFVKLGHYDFVKNSRKKRSRREKF